METSGFRKSAVVEAEPWGGLGEERGSLPPEARGDQRTFPSAVVEAEPWGGLGEERGSLPPGT
jgi:hypothetical protein